MKKKALTKKEINEAIVNLHGNDNILLDRILKIEDKLLQIDHLIGLNFEFRKETYREDPEEFNKFVTSKLEKAGKFEQQRSEDKKGA